MALIQIRPDMEADCRPVEWIAYGSNAFNALVPFYADVEETPEYLNNTTGRVSTENFYWSSRLIAAMADASYNKSLFHVERYQERVAAKGHELINAMMHVWQQNRIRRQEKRCGSRQMRRLLRCCRRKQTIRLIRCCLS